MTDDEKIEIIHNSLSDEEELLFIGNQDRKNFNKYMLYLNFLEEEGYVKINIKEDFLSNKRKIIVEKIK